jgi:hypothetical protein
MSKRSSRKSAGKHLLNLQEIGISNFEDRMRVSQQLAVRTAEQITKIQSMDVPPTMKTQLVDAAVKGYQQLFEKIPVRRNTVAAQGLRMPDCL